MQLTKKHRCKKWAECHFKTTAILPPLLWKTTTTRVLYYYHHSDYSDYSYSSGTHGRPPSTQCLLYYAIQDYTMLCHRVYAMPRWTTTTTTTTTRALPTLVYGIIVFVQMVLYSIWSIWFYSIWL